MAELQYPNTGPEALRPLKEPQFISPSPSGDVLAVAVPAERTPVVPRRTILIGLAAAAIMTGIPSSSSEAGNKGFGLEREQLPITEAAAAERLQRAGLTSYGEIYTLYRDFDRFFGVAPTFANDDSNIMRQALYEVVSGVGNEHNVARIRDGWNETQSKEELYTSNMEAAVGRAAQLRFENSETTDSEQLVRTALHLLAQDAPVQVLAMPDLVRMIDPAKEGIGGGYAADRIELPSFNSVYGKRWTGAVVPTYHETTHALEANWERCKPYMRRDEFTYYITTKLKAVLNFATEHFSTPYIAAAGNVTRGSFYTSSPYSDQELADFEQALGFIERPDNALANIEGMAKYQDAHGLRYDRLMHFVGQRYLQIAHTPADKRTAADLQFIAQPTARKFINQFIGDINHYFVGPVQSYYAGGLPESADQLTLDSITLQNLNVQRAKMALAGTVLYAASSDSALDLSLTRFAQTNGVLINGETDYHRRVSTLDGQSVITMGSLNGQGLMLYNLQQERVTAFLEGASGPLLSATGEFLSYYQTTAEGIHFGIARTADLSVTATAFVPNNVDLTGGLSELQTMWLGDSSSALLVVKLRNSTNPITVTLHGQ